MNNSIPFNLMQSTSILSLQLLYEYYTNFSFEYTIDMCNVLSLWFLIVDML